MVVCRYAGVYLIVLLLGNVVYADGLFYRLPKDGTWASYDVDVKLKTNAGKISLIKKMRIASVGQATVNGHPCRWIEVQSLLVSTTPQPKMICKLLIPEKYMVQGETPFKHILRLWVRMEAPDPFGFEFEGEMTNDPYDLKVSDAMLPIILSGPCEKTSRSEAIQVDTKYGKLICTEVKGIYELTETINKATKCEVKSILHPLSPYGTITSLWKEIKGEDQGEIAFILTDYGDGAISEITGNDNKPTTSSSTSSDTHKTNHFIMHYECGRKAFRCRKHFRRRLFNSSYCGKSVGWRRQGQKCWDRVPVQRLNTTNKKEND